MMQLNFNQIVLQPGHAVLLRDISWTHFENLLNHLGEHRSTRITYNQGLLEIMVPSPEHEVDKKLISDMVQILLEEMGVEFWPLGSTTFKNSRMIRALEADECFYIEHETNVRGKSRIDLEIDPPPDLALEIDITQRTRFDNYEKLGVPEFWRFDGQALEIHVLENGAYIRTDTSLHFPMIPLVENLPNFIAQASEKGRNATIRAFRSWIKNYL